MGLPILSLLLSLVLQAVSSEQVIGTYNQMLDPGRLYWWKTKWAPGPIELSSNNAEAKAVSATFYFNPATSVKNGVLEVTFPSGFALAAGTGVTINGQVATKVVSLVAGVDTTVTIDNIGLPTAAGAYGPFALRTRLAAAGQAIDANLNFGMVYITTKPSTMSSGSVSYVPTQSVSTVNKGGNYLSFKFTINKDLWTYDVFRVTVDPSFTLALGNNDCSSADYAGAYNNFNGTRTASPHILDCVASDKVAGSAQTLWVYGLAVGMIDVSLKENTRVDLRVPGFTNPAADYDTASYSWTIETVRFGTKTTLETITVTGPDTTPEAITIATWKPTWGMANSNIVPSLTMYMDFSVSLVNAVPKTGQIVLELSETAAECYVLSNLAATTACASSGAGKVFTVTGFVSDPSATAQLPAGTTLVVRHLVTFGSTALANASVKVSSQDANGKIIDTGSGLGAIKVASTTDATKITTFTTFFQDQTGGTTLNKAGGTGDASQYVAFVIGSSASIAGWSISIYCPLASTIDDLQLSLPTVSYVYKAGTTPDFSTPDGTLTGSTAGTNGSLPTVSVGSISAPASGLATYKAGSISFIAGSAYGNSVSIGVSATSGVISLPRVTNNLMTAYECRVEMTPPSSTTSGRLIGAHQFTIAGQEFNPLSFSFFCRNAAYDGNPLKVSFKPKVVDLFASSTARTYNVEIGMPTAFDTLHGSGLAVGDLYPVDTNLSTGVTMKLSNTDIGGATFSHVVTGLGQVATTAASNVDLYFPVKGLTAAASPSFTLRTYYTLTADTRSLKYVTHSATYNSYAVTMPQVSTGFSSATLGGGAPVNAEALSSALTVTAKLGAAISGDTYFFIVLPRGFAFTNLRDVQSGGSSFADKKFFSSTYNKFNFPGVLVKSTITGLSISSTTATTFSIMGLVAALGADTAGSEVKIIHGSLDGDLTADCYSMTSALKVATSIGTILSWQVSPKTIQARGPNGVDLTHTIVVVLPHGIDQGGSIEFTVNTEWGYGPNFKCDVTGLNNALCTQTGSLFTISGFDDFSKLTNVAVSIYLRHMLPPVLSSTTPAQSYQLVYPTNPGDPFFKTKTSPSLGSRTIDQSSSSTNGVVSITQALSPGISMFQSLIATPANAGTIDNDMYFRFSLQYDLPALSVISVTLPYTPTLGTDLRNSCWFSPLMSTSCVLSGKEVQVTIGENYLALSTLELFVRRAVTAPADVPAPGSTTVYSTRVSATWGGASIIADPTSVPTSHTIVPKPKVSTAILPATAAISFAPLTTGEVATYTLAFKLSQPIADTDQLWVVWPDDFDPYLGQATETLSQEPGNFYLSCASTQLGASINCRVDHWVLVVSALANAQAPLDVSLAVEGVLNPPGDVTTGSFRVYHFDGNSTLVEYVSDLGKVKAATVAPKLIQVKSVVSSSNVLFSNGDYSFTFYFDDTVTVTSRLQIQFPPEYDLRLLDGKDSYPCSTTFVDEDSTTNTGSQEWNTGANCEVSGNRVSMTPPTVEASFKGNQRVSVVVKGVTTPQYGLRREGSAKTDWELTDRDVFMTYSWWTSRFSFFIYQSAATGLKYTSRSYTNVNAAYLGFMQPQRYIAVNNYNPFDRSNRIIVWPGTQSQDLLISTANSTTPLAAKSLTFEPRVNSKTPDSSNLKFSSTKSSFIMLYNEQSIAFRVAANINTPKGLYYINWLVTEAPLNGTDSGLYSTPPMTLVEVPAKTYRKYVFTVGDIPPIPVGGRSLPIKVSISNAPATDVSVDIGVLTIDTATVTPSSLVFSPDVNELYFYISVNSTHDSFLYSSFAVSFAVSGTDADAYAIQPAVSVRAVGADQVSSGNVIKLGIDTITSTTVQLTPVTDSPGIVYYMVAPKGTDIPTFQEIKDLVRDFENLALGNSTDGSGRQQAEVAPEIGETWQAFQTRKYLEHISSYRYASGIAIASTIAADPSAVTGLMAETDYQVVGYLDVLNGDYEPSAKIEYFTTSDLPMLISCAVTFKDEVPEAMAGTIGNYLAKYMNVNPTRVVNGKRTTTTARVLQSTSTTITSSTFTFTLLNDRFINAPTPAQAAVLSDQSLADLRNDLRTRGIVNTVTAYGVVGPLTPTVPTWTTLPQVMSFGNTTVTVNLLASTAGTTCCVALERANVALLPEQVILGYSFNWTASPQACGATDLTATINELVLAGLQPDTNYYVSCAATDNLPIWPTLMQYSTTVPVPFIPIHTKIYDVEPEVDMTAATLLAGIYFLVF